MLHHVAFEVQPDDMAGEGMFWQAAGFERVPAPDGLGEGFTWYESEGTQIHLIETADAPTPPSRGHVAVIAGDIEATVDRLVSAGFEVSEGRRLWGERRLKVKSPAGHLVEIMAAPPASAGEGG